MNKTFSSKTTYIFFCVTTIVMIVSVSKTLLSKHSFTFFFFFSLSIFLFFLYFLTIMYIPTTKKTTLWYKRSNTYSLLILFLFWGTNTFFLFRMGDLEPWMDEQYISRIWFHLNANVIVKVIRDKLTL